MHRALPVDAQLQAKGLRRTDETPSLYVASFALTKSQP
jgi:hypothetical protein